MDNKWWVSRAREGAQRLGLTLPEPAALQLLRYVEELLRWNKQVNLTAIQAPEEVLEKHILDSAAALPEVGTARSLLDIGAGAGFPGIPLSVLAPGLEVTLIDAVAKKVGFMKSVIATLGLAGRVRALHLSARGEVEREGVGQAERVICRALMELSSWLPLARPYLAPGGWALAMVARQPDAEAVARAHGYQLVSVREFQLPFSGAARAVLAFEPQPSAHVPRETLTSVPSGP